MTFCESFCILIFVCSVGKSSQVRLSTTVSFSGVWVEKNVLFFFTIKYHHLKTAQTQTNFGRYANKMCVYEWVCIFSDLFVNWSRANKNIHRTLNLLKRTNCLPFWFKRTLCGKRSYFLYKKPKEMQTENEMWQYYTTEQMLGQQKGAIRFHSFFELFPPTGHLAQPLDYVCTTSNCQIVQCKFLLGRIVKQICK